MCRCRVFVRSDSELFDLDRKTRHTLLTNLERKETVERESETSMEAVTLVRAFGVGSFYSTLGISRLWPDTAPQAKHLWTQSTLWNRAAVICSPTPSAIRSCIMSACIRTISLLAGSALSHRSLHLVGSVLSPGLFGTPCCKMSPSPALLSTGQWSNRSTSAARRRSRRQCLSFLRPLEPSPSLR